MKYYCENCGTEYSVTGETEAALESYRKDFAGIIGGSEIKCSICPYIPNSLPSELKPLPAGILYKDIENRTWKTNYRGKILIHASKYPCDTLPRLNGIFTDADFLRAIVYETPRLNGMIIGSAELLDCVTNSKSVWAEPDMWHWVLGNPKPLGKPVPAKGSLGLWEYSDCSDG